MGNLKSERIRSQTKIGTNGSVDHGNTKSTAEIRVVVANSLGSTVKSHPYIYTTPEDKAHFAGMDTLSYWGRSLETDSLTLTKPRAARS